MDLVFLSDFGLCYWFFKGTWIWFFFRTLDFVTGFQRDVDLVFLSDFGLLDGLTQEYGLVFRTLDWFFFSDIGLVLLSDFGYFNFVLLDYIKIEILSALFSFCIFLFALLLGNLIYI